TYSCFKKPLRWFNDISTPINYNSDINSRGALAKDSEPCRYNKDLHY
ncbi:37051_t:CDS:1, partial [Racocetra persica]